MLFLYLRHTGSHKNHGEVEAQYNVEDLHCCETLASHLAQVHRCNLCQDVIGLTMQIFNIVCS